ncbi:MAG TPA: phosphotransferase family protein [Burkholderiales bacterium]|jgi:aminoglycoside phosphotransferase (APT) family kinase protein|nr:phosphotransferase family protein [Burkholderiales bacterium]
MSDQFVGVKPVAEKHRFDEARLEAFLEDRIEGWRGPMKVEQFKGGQSNPTYRISAGGKRYALRRKPPGKLLPSAHAVDREFKVISALHRTGFPVAKPYVLCEDESVIGTAFYVMDCVEGRVIWDQSLPGMTKDQRAAIWDELNRVIALLHTIDYKAIGLEDFGKPGNYIERQIGRWTKQYLASETVKIEAMNRLIEWLPKNIPAGDETTIVHGDYRLDNTIFHPTEPRILAVLDWELSTLGHPMADFAYHCMSWHIPPGQFRGISGLDHAQLGIPTEAQYVEAYCRRLGRKPVPPSVWDYYMAYNLFRIAAILQGIAKRVVDGTAASAHAAEAGGRARLMAELAWKQVEQILKRAA